MAEEKSAITATKKNGGSSITGKYRHSLEGNLFQEALERYVDENKPDPLVLKQIQGWEMQWSSCTSKDDAKNMILSTADLNFAPTDWLQGTLTWKSDYMFADITAFCCWEPHCSEESSQVKPANNKEGSLYFVLKAALRFRTKHDKANKSNSSNKGEKNKSEDKIRSKMIQRLREDTYIKKLIPDNTSSTNTDNNSQEALVLCEARVSLRISPKEGEPEQLEERVDVTDHVAEGLRRALFSQAESSLDVVEVLLSLPILPGTAHTNLAFQCPLADRTKLRLLEDAMFDACEREGEDELIDDLKISSATTTEEYPSSKGGKPGPSKHPKTQPSSTGRSSKRTKR